MRKRIISVAVLAFAAGLAFGAASMAWAQLPATPKATVAVETDLKFRITGMHQGRAVGTLLAKVDGKWVEVQLAPQDMLLRGK